MTGSRIRGPRIPDRRIPDYKIPDCRILRVEHPKSVVLGLSVTV